MSTPRCMPSSALDRIALFKSGRCRFRKDANWEEDKHPRADNGQFGSGSGSSHPSSSKKPSKTKRKMERRAEAAGQGKLGGGAIQTLLGGGGSALDKIGWLNTNKPKEPEPDQEKKPEPEKKPVEAPAKAPEKKPEPQPEPTPVKTPDKKPEPKPAPKPKKFSDAKKDIEIALVGTSHNNAISQSVFSMKITRPVVADAKFRASEVRTKEGMVGVNFSRDSDIGKILGKGKQDVFLTLSPEAVNHIKEENEKNLQELKEAAAKVDVKTWRWTDDGMPVYYPKGVETEFRPDLAALQDKVKRYHTQIWRAMQDASERDPDENGYRWYEIPHDKLLEIVASAEKKQNDRDKAHDDKKHAQEAAAFDRARETGKKEEIRRWTSPCEDDDEECSTDIIVEYAQPDGSKSTKRSHTY